jgi:hypothetical protein
MRFDRVALAAAAALGFAAVQVTATPAQAQTNPFLGAWNITGDPPNSGNVYWLEVKDDGGKPTATFLNRGGSPVPATDVKIENGMLTFTVAGNNPKNTVMLHAADGKLTGTVGANAVKVTGVRPPAWGACDANGAHTFGTPVALFDGKSLDAFGVQNTSQPSGWKVEDGVMTNQPRANNLVSKQSFWNYKLEAEYKLSDKGNSGLYQRGRYEMQVLDDAGSAPGDVHGHMSFYARKAPDKNVSKKAGEWQTATITVVGNCLTAVLNGETVQNNIRLTGITGGALDAREAEPGPIMIQGDHEVVWFRKVVVTPITDGPAPPKQ